MSRKDLGHCSCLPLLFPLLLFSSFPRTLIPLSLLHPSLSHALTLLSLSLPKLAQLSISPPAVPPAVCPPQTRSPTTIQVTGQEKEQAAFTMDQWRPVKQSFPFSRPPFLRCCQDWKRQTFGEVAKGGPLEQQPPRHLPLLTIAKRTTMINTRTHHLLLSPHYLFTFPSRSLSNSRANMPFNTIIKVRTETFVIS